jgi:hypothetical protein
VTVEAFRDNDLSLQRMDAFGIELGIDGGGNRSNGLGSNLGGMGYGMGDGMGDGIGGGTFPPVDAATLGLYDLQGHLLENQQFQASGHIALLQWSRPLPPGIYLVRIRMGNTHANFRQTLR